MTCVINSQFKWSATCIQVTKLRTLEECSWTDCTPISQICTTKLSFYTFHTKNILHQHLSQQTPLILNSFCTKHFSPQTTFTTHTHRVHTSFRFRQFLERPTRRKWREGSLRVKFWAHEINNERVHQSSKKWRESSFERFEEWKCTFRYSGVHKKLWI